MLAYTQSSSFNSEVIDIRLCIWGQRGNDRSPSPFLMSMEKSVLIKLRLVKVSLQGQERLQQHPFGELDHDEYRLHYYPIQAHPKD